MARIKNKHGLTPQQEMFCQYVVDAYGTDTTLGVALPLLLSCYYPSVLTHWHNVCLPGRFGKIFLMGGRKTKHHYEHKRRQPILSIFPMAVIVVTISVC